MKKLALLALVGAWLLAGCTSESGGAGGAKRVRLDGSSTVFPISEAIAEEFQKTHQNVRVTVGVSGTGGGFKKFGVGETDLNNASRPIKPKEESKAKSNQIEYIELPVAYDGISVVIHPKNKFVDELTVAELTRIWEPDSKVSKWSDVRDGWPNQPIELYGPGPDSGTFDYFTEAVNGKSQRCRSDFTASENDNVIVNGVSGDENSLGFFGYAYYKENQSKVRVVPINNAGAGAIVPAEKTINDGTYTPLSRPVFIYVSVPAAERPEVQDFVRFYLQNAAKLVQEVGYVALPERAYELALERFDKRITGSAFRHAEAGVDIVELLEKSNK